MLMILKEEQNTKEACSCAYNLLFSWSNGKKNYDPKDKLICDPKDKLIYDPTDKRNMIQNPRGLNT